MWSKSTLELTICSSSSMISVCCMALARMVMGMLAGSIPWFTVMILHKKSALLGKVDDMHPGRISTNEYNKY